MNLNSVQILNKCDVFLCSKLNLRNPRPYTYVNNLLV